MNNFSDVNIDIDSIQRAAKVGEPQAQWLLRILTAEWPSLSERCTSTFVFVSPSSIFSSVIFAIGSTVNL